MSSGANREHVVENLECKSKEELTELLKKQQQLLANRKLVDKLPDKGAKITLRIDKILESLEIVRQNESRRTLEMFSMAALAAELPAPSAGRGIPEPSGGRDQAPSDIGVKQMEANGSHERMNAADGVRRAWGEVTARDKFHPNRPAKKLKCCAIPNVDDANIPSPHGGIPMECDVNTGSILALDSALVGRVTIDSALVGGVSVKTNQERPNRTTSQTLNNGSHKLRKFKYDESLRSVSDGLPSHEQTQLISLDESLALIAQHTASLQAAQEKQATEKLTQSFDVQGLGKYNPSATVNFRSRAEIVSDDDDDDENDKEFDYPE